MLNKQKHLSRPHGHRRFLKRFFSPWPRKSSSSLKGSNELDFEDGSAFSKLPTWKLKLEILMFRIMNDPKQNKKAQKLITYLLENGWPIDWFLKLTIFGHFCGGESVKGCRGTINKLRKRNVSTILDYSKESGNESTFDNTVEELLKTIYEGKENNNVSFAVFKFTGIADMQVLENISNGTASEEDKRSFEKVKIRVNRICQVAYESGVKILVDAEHSWIQPAIDTVTEEMMIKYNRKDYIVYNTVQLYRHDRLAYIKSLHSRLNAQGIKTAMKLVRGAYMEKEHERAIEYGYVSPIQLSKDETDRDYNLALEYCVENIDTIAICAGNNNPNSVKILADLMAAHLIDKGDKRVFFAQLLGMGDHISYTLGAKGYNVAKYVPYGKVKEVLPYLFRRADENKSMGGEVSRELKIRTTELARRKKYSS